MSRHRTDCYSCVNKVGPLDYFSDCVCICKYFIISSAPVVLGEV